MKGHLIYAEDEMSGFPSSKSQLWRDPRNFFDDFLNGIEEKAFLSKRYELGIKNTVDSDPAREDHFTEDARKKAKILLEKLGMSVGARFSIRGNKLVCYGCELDGGRNACQRIIYAPDDPSKMVVEDYEGAMETHRGLAITILEEISPEERIKIEGASRSHNNLREYKQGKGKIYEAETERINRNWKKPSRLKEGWSEFVDFIRLITGYRF
ncbi:MAG: hypothetical protein AABX54_01715 [Nanoarchaeota archaeon]